MCQAHSRHMLRMMRKLISGPVRKVIAHRADKGSGLPTVALVSCEVTEKPNDIVDLERPPCTESISSILVKTDSPSTY